VFPVQVYISIGSNLDDPPAQVARALAALAALPDSSGLIRSPIYRSAPLGPPSQPHYLNAVVRLDTSLPPLDLLRALQRIETAQGRVRTERWGARTLDLDLLLYGDLIRRDPVLTIPHPRLPERAFVLYPLHDLAPDLELPGLGDLVTLIRRCPSWPLERLPEPERP
jgi:2-amino-4-hydroxy-6-hydroxymethyldihydropteridine diphosphokinase